MIDDFTIYTDKILSEVSMYFQSAPTFYSKRTGKKNTGNFLPKLHHIIIQTQKEFAGLFTDFSDADKIYMAFSNYVRLVAEVNSHTELSATRTLFCSFIGISTNIYLRMLQDSPQNIRDALSFAEDYHVNILQTGALDGTVGSNAAKMVLNAAGQYGHGVVSLKEVSDIRATQQRMLSADELEQNLKRITATNK